MTALQKRGGVEPVGPEGDAWPGHRFPGCKASPVDSGHTSPTHHKSGWDVRTTPETHPSNKCVLKTKQDLPRQLGVAREKG